MNGIDQIVGGCAMKSGKKYYSRFFLQPTLCESSEDGAGRPGHVPCSGSIAAPLSAVTGLTVGAENVFFGGCVVSQVCEVKAF